MLVQIVEEYLKIFPDEKDGLKRLLQQLADKEKLNDRRNFRGHITGSAIVLSPDKKKILLIHHKHQGRWQQPGGHWESDEEQNPLEVAAREAEEETKVRLDYNLPVTPKNQLIPLEIDSHPIPARPEKDEPPHWHHDFRYVFIAQDERLHHRPEEVFDARWCELDNPLTKNVSVAINKMQKLGFLAK